MFRLASAVASLAATRANLALRSMCRRSLGEMWSSGLKFFTSPPMRTPNPDASNSEIVSMPEQPASRLAQVSGTLVPTGVTAPRPVTTTRRGSGIQAHCVSYQLSAVSHQLVAVTFVTTRRLGTQSLDRTGGVEAALSWQRVSSSCGPNPLIDRGVSHPCREG